MIWSFLAADRDVAGIRYAEVVVCATEEHVVSRNSVLRAQEIPSQAADQPVASGPAGEHVPPPPAVHPIIALTGGDGVIGTGGVDDGTNRAPLIEPRAARVTGPPWRLAV